MSTMIINRPYPPMLLLSPDGSRDVDGPVSPTIDGSAPVVAGEYGNAWDVTSGQITTPSLVGHGNEGTVLIRTLHTGDTSQSSARLFTTNTSALAQRIQIFHTTGRLVRVNTPTANQTMASGFPPNQWSFIAIRWDGTTIDVPDFGFSGAMSTELTEGPMRLSSTSNGARWFGLVESMLVFDIALTDGEIVAINDLDEAWTWQNVSALVQRPAEVALTFPQRGNRNTHVETVVFETDRDNRPGVEIPGIADVQVDWDIDRPGSKARIEIATHKRALRDGMWIAPYLRITPEVGDIVYQQLGHFRLGLPTTIVDGSVDEWGDDKVEQSATGGDIVDLLADASLPFTFYTPVNGLVLDDVQVLIKMATSGGIGPNIVPNGGFEQEGTGWTLGFGNGGSGTHTWSWSGIVTSPIEGKKAWGAVFNASQPGGAYAVAYRDLPLPQGYPNIYVAGVMENNSNGRLTGRIEARFIDSDGGTISGATITTRTIRNVGNRRIRVYEVGAIPPEAASIRLFVFSEVRTGGLTGVSRQAWDDIQLGGCTNNPLPPDRVNLPPSSAAATTRIQTTGGASIGYDAINADRLSALGHHALYTDLIGRLTSSPSRDLARAAVARTYREGDYRFAGAFEVQRSASNRYNTVTAVKESFEEGVEPLVVTVWNDDPEDPWSVHHLGSVRYPNGPLLVQDAVDESALEAAALATLARATMQHTLRIQVLHDPSLRVHDVIEVAGGPEEAQGRWLIEYIRPGMAAFDSVVEIGARRTLASVGGVS